MSRSSRNSSITERGFIGVVLSIGSALSLQAPGVSSTAAINSKHLRCQGWHVAVSLVTRPFTTCFKVVRLLRNGGCAAGYSIHNRLSQRTRKGSYETNFAKRFF